MMIGLRQITEFIILFFHSIRAVLALEKIDFKKHSAVIAYFNKNYILTDIFDKSYGKVVNNAFEI